MRKTVVSVRVVSACAEAAVAVKATEAATRKSEVVRETLEPMRERKSEGLEPRKVRVCPTSKEDRRIRHTVERRRASSRAGHRIVT